MLACNLIQNTALLGKDDFGMSIELPFEASALAGTTGKLARGLSENEVTCVQLNTNGSSRPQLENSADPRKIMSTCE